MCGRLDLKVFGLIIFQYYKIIGWCPYHLVAIIGFIRFKVFAKAAMGLRAAIPLFLCRGGEIGRRTSLRNWRASTVRVQVPPSAPYISV